MISLTMVRAAFIASLFVVGIIALACGSDDDVSESGSPTPSESGSGSPTATPSINLTPPLEGPDRGPAATERTDFREDPEWQLPDPEDLSAAPADEDGAIYSPPATVECPAEWTLVQRPSEGFSICHPQDWQTAGNGYVSEGAEDRWYSHGIVKFADENRDQETAHVSVYAIPRFARPMTYTRDCPRPYSITFAGEPSVICPEFPADTPEEDFASYHLRRGDLDYFVQIVRYEGTDDETYDLAVQIAQTFQLIDLSTP